MTDRIDRTIDSSVSVAQLIVQQVFHCFSVSVFTRRSSTLNYRRHPTAYHFWVNPHVCWMLIRPFMYEQYRISVIVLAHRNDSATAIQWNSVHHGVALAEQINFEQHVHVFNVYPLSIAWVSVFDCVSLSECLWVSVLRSVCSKCDCSNIVYIVTGHLVP